MTVDINQVAVGIKEQISTVHYRLRKGYRHTSDEVTLEHIKSLGKDPSDEDVLCSRTYDEKEFHQKFAEFFIKDCTKTIIKAYGGHINPAIALNAINEKYDIDMSETKICSNKVNGVCQLHNLFCQYPECEK